MHAIITHRGFRHYIFVIVTSFVGCMFGDIKIINEISHWKNINQQHLLTINHLNVLSISNFWHGHISSNENDLSNLSSAASIYVEPIIYIIVIRNIDSWPADCNFLLFSCAMEYASSYFKFNNLWFAIYIISPLILCTYSSRKLMIN